MFAALLAWLLRPYGARVHAFELHDFAWFPVWLRNHVTDILRFSWCEPVLGFAPIVARVAAHLAPLFAARRVSTLVDLCSGGGGPVPRLLTELHAAGLQDTRAVLTDLYPNEPAFRAAVDAAPRGALTFVSTPVDATACNPTQLVAESGSAAAKPIVCRTMFLSFHHMTPALATAILADAVAKQDMIAVFELQHRAPLTLLINLFLLFLLPYVALLTRKVGWEFSRVFFTLVVPVIPFVVAFDGLVSSLRTYSHDEMRALIRAADPHERFAWAIETRPAVRAWLPFVPLISCVGLPK
jgi:hypothetical protein